MSLKLNHEANYYYYKFGSTILSLWNFFRVTHLRKFKVVKKGRLTFSEGAPHQRTSASNSN